MTRYRIRAKWVFEDERVVQAETQAAALEWVRKNGEPVCLSQGMLRCEQAKIIGRVENVKG